MTTLATLLPLAAGRVLAAGLTLAQAPPPPPSAVQVSRSWTMEILISVVFAGLAIFAVCRRSNRG